MSGAPSDNPVASTADAADAAIREFEREQRRLQELHQKMDSESTVVQAKDHSLALTFDGRGELTGMKFIGGKFRSMAPAKLARVIVETMQAGRAQCIEKLTEGMGERLPGVSFADLARGKVNPAEVLDSLLRPIFAELGDRADGVFARPSHDNGKQERYE